MTSTLVIVIGWFYIVPQLQGAALTVRITTGLPAWVGSVAVAVIVAVVVAAGGMRSITFVQAFQFWLKLTALAVPVVALLLVVGGGEPPAQLAPAEAFPASAGPGELDVYRTVSLMVALLLGTLGLPHVLVRFYTNPDGVAARRTTVIVLVLLSVFYLFPTIFGLLGRAFAPDLAASGEADALILLLPDRLVPGPLGDVLTALVIAGAFAAFLSTSSGLVVSLAGVISQDLLGGSVRGFRIAAIVSTVVPLARGARDRVVGPRGQRRPRVRVHRIDPVPHADPRHLVARPHRARRDRGHAHGRRAVGCRDPRGAARGGIRAVHRAVPRTARRVDRAARGHRDGHGVTARSPRNAGGHRRVPHPAARARASDLTCRNPRIAGYDGAHDPGDSRSAHRRGRGRARRHHRRGARLGRDDGELGDMDPAHRIDRCLHRQHDARRSAGAHRRSDQRLPIGPGRRDLGRIGVGLRRHAGRRQVRVERRASPT